MQIRVVVKWFAERMENKLMQNEHKNGWRNMSIEDLYARMLDEVSGLQSEINFPDQDKDAIIKECANVANFALMIADVVQKKSEGLKTDE